MKLSQGDSVIVIAGKDKGKKGTVLRVIKHQNRVIVSGVNIATKHVKKTAQSEGKIVKLEVSLSASNVMVLDPKTGKGTRVGYKVEGGKKIRMAKKSGTVLTRAKIEGSAKGDALGTGKKSPFWKRSGFGSDAAADGTSTKAEAGPAKAAVPITRSAGRGA